MAKNLILCDLIISVGTYQDAAGNTKSKSRKLGTLCAVGNRLYGLAPSDMLNPTVASGAQRASAAYKRSTGAKGAAAEPDYDINLSLMTEAGKPLTVALLLEALRGSGTHAAAETGDNPSSSSSGSDDSFDDFS